MISKITGIVICIAGIQLFQKSLSSKNLKPYTLSAQEMLGNFYLQPKTPEFYSATMREHKIHTDNV